MDYLVPRDGETMEMFWERVHTEMRRADNAGMRRPRLSIMFRAGYKIYKEQRRVAYHERVKQKLLLEGAGSREGIKFMNQLPDGKVERRNPGSRGGRSSTYRSREARDRYLKEAGDDGFCKACYKFINHDKAKILCVDPQEPGKKYVAVICKGCSQGINIRMQTRAGIKVWQHVCDMKDGNIRAWIRWKLATVADDKLEKFRKYVLGLSRNKVLRR